VKYEEENSLQKTRSTKLTVTKRHPVLRAQFDVTAMPFDGLETQPFDGLDTTGRSYTKHILQCNSLKENIPGVSLSNPQSSTISSIPN